MSKLNQWLTLVANVSVVVGIVFLAVEMQQNTQAIQAQTRHGLSDQVLEITSWMATSDELPAIESRVSSDGADVLAAGERQRYGYAITGFMRMWENEFYQYESGLFSEETFQARMNRWRNNMADASPRGDFYRFVWQGQRDRFDPSFRAEIDRIVAEVEQAQ